MVFLASCPLRSDASPYVGGLLEPYLSWRKLPQISWSAIFCIGERFVNRGRSSDACARHPGLCRHATQRQPSAGNRLDVFVRLRDKGKQRPSLSHSRRKHIGPGPLKCRWTLGVGGDGVGGGASLTAVYRKNFSSTAFKNAVHASSSREPPLTTIAAAVFFCGHTA